MRFIVKYRRTPQRCESCDRRASTKTKSKQHRVRIVGDMVLCHHCIHRLWIVEDRLDDDTTGWFYFMSKSMLIEQCAFLFEQTVQAMRLLNQSYGMPVGRRGTFVVPIHLRHTP